MKKSIFIALTLVALVFAACSKSDVEPTHFNIEVVDEGYFVTLSVSNGSETQYLSTGSKTKIYGKNLYVVNFDAKKAHIIVGDNHYIIEPGSKHHFN